MRGRNPYDQLREMMERGMYIPASLVAAAANECHARENEVTPRAVVKRMKRRGIERAARSRENCYRPDDIAQAFPEFSALLATPPRAEMQ